MTDTKTSTRKYIILRDADDREAFFDDMTNALVCVDYFHHETHEGDAFTCDITDETMADNATLVLAFKTPAGTQRCHMFAEFKSALGSHMDFLEGPTWTNQTGTQQPIFNRHRGSAKVSVLLEDQSSAAFTATNNLIANPTGLAGGTIFHDLWSFAARAAASEREDNEWILKPDTQYAFRLTSDNANNKGQLILSWYRHTDSN